MLAATMTDHPEAASADPVPCADLVTAYSIVGLTDTPAASAHVALRASGSPRWMGSETLSSYPGDGATKVLSEIRSLVHQCPTATGRSGAGYILADPSLGAAVDGPLTTHFSIADGPKLGDESLRLQARTSSQVAGTEIEADAIVIRSGNRVLVVDELSTYAQFSKLTDVAAAAYQQLTTA
jgi:hypothetical protein